MDQIHADTTCLTSSKRSHRKLTIAQWIYQQKGQVDGETNTYYPSLGPPASNVLPPPCPSFKKNNFLQEKQHMVSAALI